MVGLELVEAFGAGLRLKHPVAVLLACHANLVAGGGVWLHDKNLSLRFRHLCAPGVILNILKDC